MHDNGAYVNLENGLTKALTPHVRWADEQAGRSLAVIAIPVVRRWLKDELGLVVDANGVVHNER